MVLLHLLETVGHEEVIREGVEDLRVIPKETEQLMDGVGGILRVKLLGWIFDEYTFLWMGHL